MKKRISALLLTLSLCVSMLVPEFSMLPAVYADDETPAVEQSADGGAAAGSEDQDAGSAAAGGAASQANDDGDAAGPANDTPGAGENSDVEGQDLTDPEDADLEEGDGEPEEEDPEEAADPIEIGAYDKIVLTDLDDQGALLIPEELKDKITISHTKYGNGVLLTGTVADLKALRLGLNCEFDFNEGSAGRLSFDGLRDKDAGMKVEAEVYLDDSETPVSTFALKKQMGKKDWSNAGEGSVSLGSTDITGKHSVSIGLNITGKKDTSTTSVALRSLQFCVTTLPIMYFNIDESEGTIDAMNSSEDHSVECYGTVDLIVPDSFNNDTSFRDEYGTQKSLEGIQLEYIRGRGNSTWNSEKKPYKVKFDKGQNLFGFGKNKHWILLANRYDNSLIRNRMTYWLGQQLGMEYTPQCVPVEVVMNGEFYGSYLLCEQIRVGTGRVEIDDLDDVASDSPAVTDDVIRSGGYLLSMDYEEDEEKLFTTKGEASFYIESPEDNVGLFRDYIIAFTQKVEDALNAEDFRDPEGNLYTDYLDMDAAVDYWWIQEFSANGDAYGSGSTYLYKKRDSETGVGKLYWGPLWDFDYVAWGDLDYGTDVPEELNYTSHPWFETMKGDPEFVNKVKTRWTEEGGLRDKLNEIVREGGLLDKYIAQMETSYNYDHDLYGPFESELTEYKEEIEQLRAWIKTRMENTEEALKDMTVDPHVVKFMVDGELVKEATVRGILKESSFPEVPEKEGMVFTGWQTEDEEIYEAGSRVTTDLVLNAIYIDESEIVQPKDIVFKSYDVYYATTIDDNEEWYWMEYNVLPEDAIPSGITWTSSNEEVAAFDEDDSLSLKDYGDTTITATLENGVSKSFTFHVIPFTEAEEYEGYELSETEMTVAEGEYKQVTVNLIPEKAESQEFIWVSVDEEIATVDEYGVVTGRGAGTTTVMAINTWTREVRKCSVTVTSANIGKTVVVNGNTYKITVDRSDMKRCMLVTAKNAAKVVIPAYITYNDHKYYVNKIGAKAFAKSKATRVTLKTKLLAKARVKNAFKGSKVKKIFIRVGKAKANKTYRKKYRKFLTKKVTGKAVIVSNS